MPKCFALVNVFTNHKYNLINKFLSREKRQVLSTNASSLLLPGMSLGQVKLAWRERTKQMDGPDKPTIHDMDKTIEFKTLMMWAKCPKLDQATTKLHLLYMKVSKEILKGTFFSSYNDVPQAKEVIEFIKVIHPH